MARFVIPTIFEAVDKYSSKVATMSRITDLFGHKFNLLSNKSGLLETATKNLIAYGEAAAVVGGAAFTGKEIMDYGTEIANLSAVTGAAGAKLQEFKVDIESVARATKQSTVDVAKAFTNVDNNMPQYHSNAAALSEVTKESIILAKASRMELAPAAEYLTMSMNQFALGADKAAYAVDAMAAGAVAGSSKISESAEALSVFGSVAANVAHLTFRESVALVELGSKFEKGTEAGTRFRNILLDMTNIKFGPAADEVARLGVNLEKVSNTSLPFGDRFKEISKISGNPAAMEKLFDKRNVAMAAGLMSVADSWDKIYNVTSKAGTAQKMAATNTDTLAESFNQLKAAWVTNITTANSTSIAVNTLTGSTKFLTNHLDGLIDTVEIAAVGFYGWKAALWAGRTSLIGLDYIIGVSIGMNRKYTASLLMNTNAVRGAGIETAAYAKTLGVTGLAGAAGIATMAIGAFYYAITDDYDAVTEANKLLDKTKNGFKQIKPVITDAQISLGKYNDAMDDYNALMAFRANRNYEYDKGSLRGGFFDAYSTFRHPFLYSSLRAYDTLQPNKMDFFKNPADTAGVKPYGEEGDDTSANFGQFAPQNNTNKPSNDSLNQTIKLLIENSTGFNINASGNGSKIPIIMKDTFSRRDV